MLNLPYTAIVLIPEDYLHLQDIIIFDLSGNGKKKHIFLNFSMGMKELNDDMRWTQLNLNMSQSISLIHHL